METKKPLGIGLREKIWHARAQFESAIQAFEQEDAKTSVETSREIVVQLSHILDEIAKGYRHALLTHKLEHFTRDEEFISKFKISENKKEEIQALMNFLVGLDRTISVLDKEISRNYPLEPVYMKYLKKNGTKIAVGAAAFLAVLILVVGWRHVSQKKQGLMGQYFSDHDLSSLYKQRLDHEIDFDWGMGSPFPHGKRDDFSIRWTGYLDVPRSATYELFIQSDDGVRLWVDGVSVIDNWTSHRLTNDSASLKLEEGYHPIMIEYFENKAQAALKLCWKSEFQSSPTAIPSKYLVPLPGYLKPGVPVFGPGSN